MISLRTACVTARRLPEGMPSYFSKRPSEIGVCNINAGLLHIAQEDEDEDGEEDDNDDESCPRRPFASFFFILAIFCLAIFRRLPDNLPNSSSS